MLKILKNEDGMTLFEEGVVTYRLYHFPEGNCLGKKHECWTILRNGTMLATSDSVVQRLLMVLRAVRFQTEMEVE